MLSWGYCCGFARSDSDSSREHVIERAAKRDLMERKRELRSASLRIARERTITVNTARAAHKRREDIKPLAHAILEADKQLERNTVMTAKLELCMGRIRRVRANRQMGRSVETAAHVMRFINTTLRSDEELRTLADRMERQMLQYTDIQEALDSATDMALSESPLGNQRGDEAADESEQQEAQTEADKVLQEVLGKGILLTPTVAVQNDNARLELIMAQIKRLPDADAKATAKRPSRVAQALGMRRGTHYQRVDDRNEVEMNDMSSPPPPPPKETTSPAVALAAAAASLAAATT